MPWPCDGDNKYISHFPETREIWSYGSGYGGNALLGKKCFALRIASTMARDEGWMAEHMLILGITSPEGEKRYIAAAFPSACGKTNMAMLIPTLPGWKVETIGDDIAWMKFGADGRLYAINPEAGFFGVAPGTVGRDQRQRHGDHLGQLHLHQRRQDRRRRRVVGGHDRRAAGAPDRLEGQRLDARPPTPPPRTPTPASPPRRRSAPRSPPSGRTPTGVPISAILFGGRRATNVPLVTESFDWQHGIFLGSIMSSEKTAAAAGTVGEVRFDPFAMLPFMGYNVGDYIDHWLEIGEATDADKLPKLFWVNWFRKSDDGRSCGPASATTAGCSSGSLERVAGTARGHRDRRSATCRPRRRSTRTGLDLDDGHPGRSCSRSTPIAWRGEVELINGHFDFIGEQLPQAMRDELSKLEERLGG